MKDEAAAAGAELAAVASAKTKAAEPGSGRLRDHEDPAKSEVDGAAPIRGARLCHLLRLRLCLFLLLRHDFVP